MKKETIINPEIQKRISRFYIIEKAIRMLMFICFIIGVVGIILFPIIYNSIKDTLFFKFYTKIVVISGISSIIIGIINGNRARRCPVCRMRMERIAPLHQDVVYKCKEHNIKVNTHIPNTTS
jgi:hypothetical protein